MNREQIIRAWKDEDYRLSLGSSELVALPAHPAGLIELTDLDTMKAGGADGSTPSIVVTFVVVTLVVTIAPLSADGTCKFGGCF